jgi:hypothetical protein
VVKPASAIQRLLQEWQSLLKQQQGVVGKLGAALPGLQNHAAPRASRRQRRIACPKCDRRFALPMNLGRHLAATHRRRKSAA